MAEAVLSFTVDKLGGLLLQEGISLYEVRDQVEWAQSELSQMQSFLKDADAKRRKGDERVKNWVRDVTEVAYRMEDAIDTFMLQVERRRRQRGLVGSVKRYALILPELIARHKVVKELEMIKIKIREISDRRAAYGINNLGEIGGDVDDSLELRRRVSPNLNDGTDVIVGFDVYCKEVASQLLDANIKKRCVISIVGMGGLGKTTLAKKIFNSREITARFSTCVWVTVSQDYRLVEIFKSISKKAMGTSREELDKMEEEEVKEKLHVFLKERAYLIVMDDIWSVDVWRGINEVLPEAMNGSRVLFTTRREDIAREADPGIPPFKLPLLDDNGSWELFTKKVFQTSPCPEELREVAEKMAKRCGGLPLALLVLGGLLSRKPATPLVWQKVYENLDWESTKDGMECLKILALSYNNLPSHYLKSCFLYMGVFPEDSEIKASKLVNLWIAEGFIQRRGRESLEDTAYSYLEELAERSLIQVVRRSMCHGGISQCRMHDLLRETCLVEAEQAGFLNVVCGGSTYDDDSNSVARDIPISRSRRFAFHNDPYTNHHLPKVPQNLRSLFVSCDIDDLPRLKLLRVLELQYNKAFAEEIRLMTRLRSFFDLLLLKLLRVLELQYNKAFAKEIRLMTHLRYLRIAKGPALATTTVESIIGMLRCLQTVDLRDLYLRPVGCSGCGFRKLPDWRELHDLRHLYLPIYTRVTLPAVATLTNLQTLKNLYVDGNEEWIKGNLARLTRLRSLSLEYKGDGSALSQALGSLIRLASLKLTSRDEVSVDIIVSLTENRHFQKLYLDAKILECRLPDSGVFPPNLAKLTLTRSELKEDPMPVLERLPNLIFLVLGCQAYMGEGMVCTTGGFPQLRTLKLDYLPYLTTWIVEAGAFANLTSLEIWCGRLDMLPRIRHVPSMKRVDWLQQIQIYPDGTYNIETWTGRCWQAITV